MAKDPHADKSSADLAAEIDALDEKNSALKKQVNDINAKRNELRMDRNGLVEALHAARARETAEAGAKAGETATPDTAQIKKEN